MNASLTFTCVMSMRPRPHAMFDPAMFPSTTTVCPFITNVVVLVPESYELICVRRRPRATSSPRPKASGGYDSGTST